MSITEDHKDLSRLASDEAEANVYELGYLVLPSVPEDNIPKVVSTIVSVIEKAEAKTLDSESPLLERLAYSMSKTIGSRKYIVDEAYIGWMKFEAEPSIIESIKIEVDKIEEVLRTLLIKAPRETTFTFKEAREARIAKEEALNNPVEEDVTTEPVATSEDVVE